MPTKKPFFSIIIPTLNEEKYLPLLLNDLVKQTFLDFEIIVVDGASSDKTFEIAKVVTGKYKGTTLQSKVAHVSVQRNLGAAQAKSDWLIFMDADIRIAPYFLEGIRYQLHKNNAIGVFTCLIAPDSPSSFSQIITNTANVGMLLYEKVGKPIAIGSLLGVRRTYHRRIKFREDLKIGEDFEFVRDCVKNDIVYKILTDPLYTPSLRRLRKEGVLKYAAIEAKALYKDLLNQKAINDDYGYVMLGGSYYDKPKSQNKFPLALPLAKPTQKQIIAIRSFFDRFTPLNKK